VAAEGLEHAAVEQRSLFGTPAARMLLGASAAQATVSFIILGLPAIGPQLGDQFDLSLATLGALLAAMQFGSGIALIGAARAVDHFGSRVATRIGTGIAALGLAFAAIGHTPPALFVGLLVAGIGAAIVPVSGAGAIFRAYPPQRRAWALGVRQMAVPVGGVIAAVAVPALNAVGGTRLVLGVGAVAVAWVGAAFAAVSDDVRIRHDSSVGMVRGIWHGPGLARLFVVTVAYLFLLQAILVYCVPAIEAAGFSTLQAGIAYFVVNATAIVSRVVLGKVADRNGGTRRKKTLVEVGVMSTVGALLFGLSLHGAYVFVVAAAIFYGFPALGWNAVVYAVAGEWAQPDTAGRAFALAATVVFVGSGLVVAVIGAIADSAGWDVLWLLAAAIGAVGTLAARSLPDRTAQPAPGPVP
jgi:MFS family permease